MSDENSDDPSRRTVLKRAGAAGVTVTGLAGAAGSASAASGDATEEAVAEAEETISGLTGLLSSHITTKTTCTSAGCSCYDADPFYRQERKEVTKKCLFGIVCWVSDEGSCGSCSPESGYGDC